MAKKIQLGYKDIELRLAALKTREVKPADVGYEILMAFRQEREGRVEIPRGQGRNEDIQRIANQGVVLLLRY